MVQFDFSISPIWLLPCAVLSALLSWWLYRRSGELMPVWLKWTLTFLRFSLFTLLFFLLLGPLLTSTTRHQNLPIIAILQDDSESLIINKDSSFLRDSLPSKLKELIGAFDKDEYNVQFHSFSQNLGKNNSPDSLTFSKEGTNISGSLDEIRKRYTHQNLGAIVIVSDGISTSGASPLYQAENIKQPVFPVLVGDTSEQKDISISTVLVNQIAYLDVLTPMQVKLKAMGYGNANLKLSVSWKGKLLEQREVNLDKTKPEMDVTFMVKPEEIGMQQYTITVTQLSDEITWRNNTKLVFLNVLENRIKIALFAGGPHPDLAALREPILSDKRYELFEFIHKTKTEFYENPDRFKMEDYDLVILHNFPFSASDAAYIEKITAQVKNRNLPILCFSGIFTDLKTAAPLFELLGIFPAGVNENFEEAQVRFQPAFAEHSTFTFDEDWIRMANQAPPLSRNRSDWRARPETKVFGTATIKNVQLGYPIFGLQQMLGRKNMVFVGENFWRIRTHFKLESQSFQPFDLWILNTIQWLVVKDDKRKFKVFPVKPLFGGNEAVMFRGEVYDDNFNPVSGAEIKLKIKSPDNKELDFYLNESGHAHYFLETGNFSEGTYSYLAEGKKGELLLGKDQGQFSVGKSNIEHFQLKADKGMMEQLALRTKGTFYHVREMAGLVDQIKAIPTLKPVVDLQKSRKGFQELTWALFLLIGIVTIEWVVRKVYSLI